MRSLPNAAETELGRVIRRLGAKGFEAALHGWLARCIPIDNIVMLAFRAAGPPLALYRQAGSPLVFAALDTTYLSGAYLLDPYHDLHARRAPAGLYRIREIAPDRFTSSRYFREYYHRTTITDEVAYVAYPAEGVTLNICLGRDASSGTVFAAREVETAARLAPVVAALAEMHWSSLPPAPGAKGADMAEEVGDRLREALWRRHGIRLSPRQAEVGLMILRGHSSVSIGLRLGVSPQTVKVFRRQLYARCGITTQAELFALLLPLLQGPGEMA